MAVTAVEGRTRCGSRESWTELVEVRQVVFAGPPFDLARITIGPSVAVWPAAVVLLQPVLILALELVVEDDPTDVGAFLAKALLTAGTRHRAMRRATTRAAENVGVKGLLPLVVTITAVRVQEMFAAVGQGHGTLATVERHLRIRPWSRRWRRPSSRGSREVALRQHSKRTRCGQRSAVFPVQFIAMIPVENQLAFQPARQVETLQEDITRIVATLARIAVALTGIVIALPRVVVSG